MFDVRESVEITLDSNDGRLCGTIKYVDAKYLIVACLPEDSAYLYSGQEITLTQLAGGNIYVMATPILTCKDSGFAVKTASIRMIQRRRTPRLECGMTAWHWSLSPPSVLATEPRKSIGWVCDISLGGAKICVENAVPNRARLWVQIEIGVGADITAKSSVIRCIALEEPFDSPYGPMRFALALQLVEMSRIDQVHLQKLVQTIQKYS